MSKKKQAKKHHKKLEKKSAPHIEHAEKKQEHPKKETPSKKSKPRFVITENIKRISTMVLIGGLMVFTILFLGFFIFEKLQEPSPLAAILPANDTIAFVEFHAAPFSRQRESLWEIVKNTPAYDPATMTTRLSEWLGVDAQTEVLPWVDTTAGGIAILTPAEGGSAPEVYMLGIKDAQAAQTFFSARALEGEAATQYDTVTIAPFPWQPEWRYAISNRYLLVATADGAIERILAVMSGDSRAVRQSDLWGQVDQNLPSVRLGMGFVNLERAIPLASKIPAIVNLLGRDFSILAPLTQVFPAAGFTLTAKDRALVVQSFTVARRSDGAPTVDLENYEGVLAEKMPSKPLAFFGGENFTEQFDVFSQLFTTVHPSGAAIVEGMVRAQIQQLFGAGDLLESDVKPLLENEYGIALYVGDSGMDFVIAINGDDETLAQHADTLKKNFIESGAVWQPVITEVTLPDGTVGKEIQAQQEPIIEDEKIIADVSVQRLSFGTYTLFYAVHDGVLQITSTEDLMMQMLNGNTDSTLSDTLSTALTTSQEITYVDLVQLQSAMSENAVMQFLQPYMAPFTKVVMTKSLLTTGTLSVAQILQGE